jgi:hypothetical protein
MSRQPPPAPPSDSAGPSGSPGGRPAPPQPPISSRGMLIGTLLLGLLLLGFALWADSAGKQAGAAARRVPQIELLEPTDGQVVQGAVALVFHTPSELRRSPDGWESDGLHIHASVDGIELMPGADDIRPLGNNRYRWQLRPLPPGERALRLFWSDRLHREIEAGASPAVRVQAR